MTTFNFVSDSLSVLLNDPASSSMATSFMFNHAISIGKWNGCSTIIRPDRLNRVPMRLLDAPERPSVSLIRKIEFLYMITLGECVDYLAKIYDCLGTPDALILECVDRYSESRMITYASIFALLHDLGEWIMKNRKINDSERELSPVVCSITADRSEHAKLIDLINRYTKFVWTLTADEEEGKFVLNRLDVDDRIKIKIDADRIVKC